MNKLVNMIKEAYMQRYTEIMTPEPTVVVRTKEEKLHDESITKVTKVEGEYDILEREIHPEKVICPDCGGVTLDGLDYCDQCGGEIHIVKES